MTKQKKKKKQTLTNVRENKLNAKHASLRECIREENKPRRKASNDDLMGKIGKRRTSTRRKVT